jgi:hypothetical protein
MENNRDFSLRIQQKNLIFPTSDIDDTGQSIPGALVSLSIHWFFLSRRQIEEHLQKSFQQEQTRQNSPQLDIMHDMQDSPAWWGLGNYLQTQYHLVFVFYIDWFNHFTNKIAGMSLYLWNLYFFG